MSEATFTVYSSNPFDLEGSLVAPYLATATLVSWERVKSFLVGKAVAVSTSGVILGAI